MGCSMRMRGVRCETEENMTFLFFFRKKNMGLAGWLGNLNHLGCRDLFYSCIHTVEFLLSTALFSSLPLPLSPIVDKASPSPPPSPTPTRHFLIPFSPIFFFNNRQSKVRRNKSSHQDYGRGGRMRLFSSLHLSVLFWGCFGGGKGSGR